MSSANESPFSIPLQKSVISANLNSTLLLLYLSGGYIGFYVFTIYIYAFSSQSRKRTVTSIISALFVITLGQLVIEWYYAYLCFVGETKNRQDTFILSIIGGPILVVLAVFMQGMCQILADALLIWRCYHILAQRRYVRFGLMCLYIVEVVSIITSAFMGGFSNLEPSDESVQFSQIYGAMQGSSLFITVATSVLATFVIGSQIYSVTSPNRHTRRRYEHIFEIIVQSSALYSLSILVQAVTNLSANEDSHLGGSAALNASVYASAITVITTAFSPTLMVARVELLKMEANKQLSTDMASQTQHSELSALEAAPQQYIASVVGEVCYDSRPHALQTAEV